MLGYLPSPGTWLSVSRAGTIFTKPSVALLEIYGRLMN
jgi:hypothetical protein